MLYLLFNLRLLKVVCASVGQQPTVVYCQSLPDLPALRYVRGILTIPWTVHTHNSQQPSPHALTVLIKI